MRNKLALYLLSALVAAPSAFAQFEGVMEMKITITGKDGTERGDGTEKFAMSKAGVRSETDMRVRQMPVHTVTLLKSDTPDTLYRINDAAKTYVAIDLSRMRQMTPAALTNQNFKVEKLGEAKIFGYNTQHVLVTGRGTSTELWTAKDLMDYDIFSKLELRSPRIAGADPMTTALKDAGADGVPLKSIATGPDGSKMTMEVVKVEKQALPASTFRIPAGYTKSEGGLTGTRPLPFGPQTKGATKKLNEAMKKMSPPQREMIERMMKQRQGTNQ